MSWKDVTDQYKQRGLVLALGAGVSMNSGLPTWDDLLRRIARKVADTPVEGDQIIDDLKSYGLGLPAIGSVLKAKGRTFKFEELLRSELYREFPFKKGITPASRQDFLRRTKLENKTLAAVAGLCAVKAAGESFERNPRIQAIVNFNLDSVLRTYIYECYGDHLLRSIERATKDSDLSKISTYYLHGFVRFDVEGDDPSEDAPDKLVLTEQEYFDFFNRPTGLFNYTFLYLLREYCCLFVGLSMIDDNIRRLLHYSREERETAYKEEGRTSRARSRVIRHFAVIKKQKGKDGLNDLLAGSLQNLGVKVLWINDFDEIPDRFGEMYRAGGGDWESVYKLPE